MLYDWGFVRAYSNCRYAYLYYVGTSYARSYFSIKKSVIHFTVSLSEKSQPICSVAVVCKAIYAHYDGSLSLPTFCGKRGFQSPFEKKKVGSFCLTLTKIGKLLSKLADFYLLHIAII